MTTRIKTLLLGAAAACALAAAPASASAAVGPGSQMYTDGAQCTANFVFTDGTSTFLGYAAHCAGTGAATDTNGCDAGSLPLGTPVEINGTAGETVNGTLAYSSWLTMNQVNETDANACNFNDFALVKVPNGSLSTSVPFFGGPTGLATTTRSGESVYSYGNSSLRAGIALLSPKRGTSLGTSGGGWTHTVYTVTPGIPGDSGSGFLNAQGRAFGVVSTVALAPLALSNGVTDLAKSLEYARTKGGMTGLQLSTGGPFSPRII